ncbi:RimK family protein [Inquilinus sp.]|uniref:RimK family protein n=1 Tax=Inquilinus sp. TaxID=1932117 RepID=UPI0031D89279
MSGWIIVVDRIGDFKGDPDGRQLVTARDYIARPQMLKTGDAKVINLTRSTAYMTRGYYVSLLAEARAHRVIPMVETILDLGQKTLYKIALPDLEDDLNRRIKRLSVPPGGPFKVIICFGRADDDRFQDFGRRVFDWFRAPILEVKVRFTDRFRIASIGELSIADIEGETETFFYDTLDLYTRQGWRNPKENKPAKYTLAVLFNPKEEFAPSTHRSLLKLARVAETMDMEVELIEKKDLLRLAEYDALFIRETTAIDNHTFRFARRAEQEGMPVIDDSTSILRCTNKVYLYELLSANKIPTPKTVVVDSLKNIERLEEEFAYPIVLKIPDGSFSRGVFKANDRRELEQMAEQLLDDSDVILAQEFMPTEHDWRVGVLDGEPLFVCQYMMAKKHWQIVRHSADGKVGWGNFKTFALDEVPAEVLDVAVRAARLIGDGLYGVDLKQTEKGVFVIEINDNPNLDHGCEDLVAKDDLWRRVCRWFIDRIDAG